ncbi:MAG: hypothetical protein C4520_21295 [Candidatus Abyssobacteria bacterium SURF_5]|uniref:Uncharacterized protein n=1 Tax=Abyssobacteria bacterium (strain SURF_5) TaxID=2093360 RepID=A0A3A4MWL4_ABYX5|nr:MAG: hypothetical protein C4520_21295 [Candidatus Abyssubacteria bacterium SURF_5]
MHQIEFDVKEREDGSIEVRFTWTHDVGLPTESVVKNQYRHYMNKEDLANEVIYFLNVEENYGEEASKDLRSALVQIPTRALKLLSFMVIDLWSETQIEYKRRKISNRRRFLELSRSLHGILFDFAKKKPNLTYGEVLAALEKEYSVIRSGAQTGATLGETLNRRSKRSRKSKK